MSDVGHKCCRCTCTSSNCVGNEFDCLDPSVDDENEEFYGCSAPPPATTPCSTDAQRAWVVDNSTQVQALASAVNCSGGEFEVEWRGHVVLDDPFYVADGTLLTVTGAGSSAVIDGNGTTRLFTVANASLALNSVQLRNGASLLGGAIAAVGSSLTFNQTIFEDNSVGGEGGALYVLHSSVSMAGVEFNSNAAPGGGGAMYVSNDSVVVSAGGTSVSFAGNTASASDGGAIFSSSSEVSLSGATQLVANAAYTAGGAVYLVAGSNMSWSGGMLISNNSCYGGGGGAIFVLNGSTVSWTGHTEFSWNYAVTDGGAVASPIADSANNPQDSTLVMGGTTTFFNNTCEGNGGALALLGACSASTAAEVTFARNSARVAGGAVFVSGAGFGPTFTDANFVMNSAQVGGAASLSGSGSAKDTDSYMPLHPTTFHRCRFCGNEASTTGGAIESAAGDDDILHSVFESNTAPVGGALRLAGTTGVYNCSFAENLAEDGEGAAVSNIGTIWWMENVSFIENAFVCPPGMYLAYNEVSPDVIRLLLCISSPPTCGIVCFARIIERTTALAECMLTSALRAPSNELQLCAAEEIAGS